MSIARATAPFIGLTLFNIIIYTAMTFFASQPRFVERLPIIAASHISVVIVCSLVFPYLSARLGREKPALAQATVFILALIPILAFVPGIETRLGMDSYDYVWFAAYGILVIPSFSNFFSLTPRHLLGKGIGSAFAGGILVWGLITLYLKGGDDTAQRVDAVRTFIQLAIAALAVCVAFNMTMNRKNLVPPPPGPPNDPAERKRRSSIVMLLGAICLFFIMNGFLGAKLFPSLPTNGPIFFTPSHGLAVVLCPLMGWLIDKKGDRGFRLIILACSLFFILAPAQVALAGRPFLFTCICMLSSLGQIVIIVVTHLAIALLIRNGRWFCLAYCATYWLRALSLLGAWLLQESTPIPSGFIAILSILATCFFYLLAGNISLDQSRPAEALRLRDAKEVLDNESPPYQQSQSIFDQHFETYGLSPRETEIAALLLKGMPAREISQSLRISENTVKTHIRNILIKTKTPNQKSFLASFMHTDSLATRDADA